MLILILICITLLFDLATYMMKKKSHKDYLVFAYAIEMMTSFILLCYGLVGSMMYTKEETRGDALILFLAVAICSVVVRIFIAALVAIAYAVERPLHKEAMAKLLPYAGEGGRVVLPRPDGKEAAGIRGDGTVRKIAMEKPLSYYFSCDVPPEGLSLQGNDLRRNIV